MCLCCGDAMIYCFVADFALMLIYCHGSCRHLIGDCSSVKRDRICRIVGVRYTMVVFDAFDAALPSGECEESEKKLCEIFYTFTKSKLKKVLTRGARTGSCSSAESSMMMIVFSSTSSMVGI